MLGLWAAVRALEFRCAAGESLVADNFGDDDYLVGGASFPGG